MRRKLSYLETGSRATADVIVHLGAPAVSPRSDHFPQDTQESPPLKFQTEEDKVSFWGSAFKKALTHPVTF